MSRQEFSVKVRKAAWERAGGICECGCGRAFGKHPKERPEYDHVIPAKLGGEATLENCQVIRGDCHKAKTTGADTDRIKKVRRGEKDRANLRPKKSRSLPGSKESGWKAKIGGGWEKRK